MRPKIDRRQGGVIAHLIMEKIGHLEKVGVNSYGPKTTIVPLSIGELENLTSRFLSTEPDPLELYFLHNRCPVCNVGFRYDGDSCYCPKCGEEWTPEKVFKKFW